MDFDFELKSLSAQFYIDFPHREFPEILYKDARPYNCIVFETNYDYFVCVPFRTEMGHKNGYHFKNSNRSKLHSSGIDYSKMVIIKDLKYFEPFVGIVDKDEYNEMVIHIQKIMLDVHKYLNDFINHHNGTHILESAVYRRKYQYSSLQYFIQDIV